LFTNALKPITSKRTLINRLLNISVGRTVLSLRYCTKTKSLNPGIATSLCVCVCEHGNRIKCRLRASLCSCLHHKLNTNPIPCLASLAVVQNCNSRVCAVKQGYVSIRVGQTQNLALTVLITYKYRAIWSTDLLTWLFDNLFLSAVIKFWAVCSGRTGKCYFVCSGRTVSIVMCAW
jgi:hypothetical protein